MAHNFIAYDIFNDHFYKREDFGSLNSFFASITASLNGGNHLTYHDYIGKTDIDGKKIYAGCSIVEFDFGTISCNKVVGVFEYSSYSLLYLINLHDRRHRSFTYDASLMKNLKIIGTLQQNKELLNA